MVPRAIYVGKNAADSCQLMDISRQGAGRQEERS